MKTNKHLQLQFFNCRNLLAVLIFFGLGLFLLGVGRQTTMVQAAAGINQQINYQARLLNAQGAVVPDGTYNIQFKIYQDGDGCVVSGSSPCNGTLKWTETRQVSNSQGVTVTNGYFSVNLGSVTAFGTNVNWNQDTLWLSVNIGGTSSSATPTYDGEMLPFKRLAANPYALNAGQLQGLAAANFIQLAQGVQTDSSTTNPSIFINKTGSTANILELQKSSSDVLVVDNSGNLTLSGNQTFASGADRTISIAQAASNTTGNTLTVAAAAGNGTGNGGTLALNGGVAGTSAGATGGNVTITAQNGSSTGSGGNGGNITLQAGNAGGDGTVARIGGSVSITAGQNVPTGTTTGGNDVTLTGGSISSSTATGATITAGGAIRTFGVDFGGFVTIQGGTGNNATGAGVVNINGGPGGTGTLSGNNVNITGGTGGSTSGNGGSVTISGGSVTSGTVGSVNLKGNAINVGTSDTTSTLFVTDTDTDATLLNGTASNTQAEVNGAIFYNSTQHVFECGEAGSWASCGGLTGSNTAASSAISNTTTETAFSTQFAMPANYCTQGRVIRWTAEGVYSTTGTPTLIFKLINSVPVVMATSPTFTTGSGASNREWRIDAQTICNAAPSGTTATETQGQVTLFTTNSTTALLGELSNTGTVNQATNGALTLQITAKWGAQSASNTITCEQFIIEGIGP